MCHQSFSFMKASNLRMIYNSIIGNLNTSMSRTLQFLVFVILLSIFALTHAPISAHSRSLPHVLMHEYLWKNDKSPSLLHYARWLASQQVRERDRERERERESSERERGQREIGSIPTAAVWTVYPTLWLMSDGDSLLNTLTTWSDCQAVRLCPWPSVTT